MEEKTKTKSGIRKWLFWIGFSILILTLTWVILVVIGYDTFYRNLTLLPDNIRETADNIKENLRWLALVIAIILIALIIIFRKRSLRVYHALLKSHSRSNIQPDRENNFKNHSHPKAKRNLWHWLFWGAILALVALTVYFWHLTTEDDYFFENVPNGFLWGIRFVFIGFPFIYFISLLWRKRTLAFLKIWKKWICVIPLMVTALVMPDTYFKIYALLAVGIVLYILGMTGWSMSKTDAESPSTFDGFQQQTETIQSNEVDIDTIANFRASAEVETNFKVHCKNCGKIIGEQDSFCRHCGAQSGLGDKYCPQCGSTTYKNALFCTKCSTRLRYGFLSTDSIES